MMKCSESIRAKHKVIRVFCRVRAIGNPAGPDRNDITLPIGRPFAEGSVKVTPPPDGRHFDATSRLWAVLQDRAACPGTSFGKRQPDGAT